MRINVQKFDLNNTKLLTNLKPTVKLTKNEFKCKKKLAAFSRFYLNLRKKPKLSKATGTIKMKVKNKDILDATTAYQTQLVDQKVFTDSDKSPMKDTKFAQYINSMIGTNPTLTPKPKAMTAKQKARDIKKCLSVKRLNMSSSVKEVESSSIPREQNININYKSKLSELRDSYKFLKISDNLNITNLKFARTSKPENKFRQKKIQASLKKNLKRREDYISGWEHDEKSDFGSLVVFDIDN